MTRDILEQHHRAPSAPVFMARALLPSPGLSRAGGFPRIVQRWTGLSIDPEHLAGFRRATGLGEGGGVSVLYPHVLGFRLQMAVLTHPAFPFPIWNALQIRNRLVRHHQIDLRDTLQLETCTGAHRLVDKGAEVDLFSRLSCGSRCCWESEVTYFYRGRFGAGGTQEARAASPDLSRTCALARFEMPSSGGWHFGGLTGDYNGIHCWPWYARRLGFRTAFPHPQRVAGMCMARLKEPESTAQSLQLWIKGPVYYGAKVDLHAAMIDDGVQFGLSLEGDHRAALSGLWQGTSS